MKSVDSTCEKKLSSSYNGVFFSPNLCCVASNQPPLSWSQCGTAGTTKQMVMEGTASHELLEKNSENQGHHRGCLIHQGLESFHMVIFQTIFLMRKKLPG